MQGVTRTQIIDSVRYQQAIAEIDEKNQTPDPLTVTRGELIKIAREALKRAGDEFYDHEDPAMLLYLVSEAEAALDQAIVADQALAARAS